MIRNVKDSDKRNERRITSVILSLVVAFGLWWYVVNNVSMEDDITFNNIPVVREGENVLNEKQTKLDRYKERINTLADQRAQDKDNALRMLCARLDGVNPLAVLSRGYSVVEKDGEIVSSLMDVSVGEDITVKVSDGLITAQITDKKARP
jgi:exonuclease VII large subunit